MTTRNPVSLLSLVVALLLCGTAASAETKGSTGLIISVEGDVSVARAGRTRPGLEGFVLVPGDTISVKTGGKCGGFGFDGRPFHLSGPAEFVLKDLSREATVDKVRGFIARQLAQWSGTSRSRSLVSRAVRDWEHAVSSPAALLPAPEGAVRASRMRFYWTTITGIDSYVVTIAPEEGEEIRQTVRGHSMVARDLEPGRSYVWKVAARSESANAVSNWSAFRVMTIEEEEQVGDALDGLSDIEAGVFLLSTGLHEEAVYRFDAAVSAGTQRRSALRWRAQALAAVGLGKDAYEDLVQTIEW